ncbi:MAG: hypothetical protein QOE61_2303, partial [Micromonosporaceae bacterium]|nr:hypothetical protein [Micromonosporaceae bacterium]
MLSYCHVAAVCGHLAGGQGMWGSNQELDAAERRINDWQAGIDKRAADAAVLSRRIAGGDAVRVDAQAYGYLCVLVPVLLDVLQHLVVGGIDAAVDS